MRNPNSLEAISTDNLSNVTGGCHHHGCGGGGGTTIINNNNCSGPRCGGGGGGNFDVTVATGAGATASSTQVA